MNESCPSSKGIIGHQDTWCIGALCRVFQETADNIVAFLCNTETLSRFAVSQSKNLKTGHQHWRAVSGFRPCSWDQRLTLSPHEELQWSTSCWSRQQGQARLGSKQPDVLADVSVHCRRTDYTTSQGSFQHNQFYDSIISKRTGLCSWNHKALWHLGTVAKPWAAWWWMGDVQGCKSSVTPDWLDIPLHLGNKAWTQEQNKKKTTLQLVIVSFEYSGSGGQPMDLNFSEL